MCIEVNTLINTFFLPSEYLCWKSNKVRKEYCAHAHFVQTSDYLTVLNHLNTLDFDPMTDKSKSSNEAESAYWPFPKNLAFSINPLRFEIKKRTKLIRIISRVNKEFQDPKSSKKVIFHAKGDSCEKCVSCVELLKKESHGEFYQWNVVKCTSGPCRNEEDDAVAAVPLPMIAIMVSKEPFPEECHSSSQQTNSSTLPSFLGAPPQKTKKARWKFQQRSTISTKSNNKWKRPEKIKAESRKGRTAKTSK